MNGGIERTLIEFGRSFVAGGDGLWGWVMRHWIPVSAVLILCGVTLDWLIWVLCFPRGRRLAALLGRITGRESLPSGADKERHAARMLPSDPRENAATQRRPFQGPRTREPFRSPAHPPVPPPLVPRGGYLARDGRPGFLKKPSGVRARPRDRDPGGGGESA